MRAIYKLANSSTSLPLLTTNLLRALFVNLKEDSLAFLAGIWIGSDEIMGENEQLCVVALRHAVAFLEAHLPEDEGVDFQTILPSLIVVLQDPDIQRRRAALECISLLSKLAQRRFSTVYGFDAIYGANSGTFNFFVKNMHIDIIPVCLKRKAPIPEPGRF
jgi:U3 small nucleolar RNA-associated protein 10